MRVSSVIAGVVTFALMMVSSLWVFSAEKVATCPKEAPYVLTGRVTDSRESPIPNAMVEVSQGAIERQSVTSDKEGEQKGTYRIDCLSGEPFSITFSAPGFGTVTEKGRKLDGDMQWPLTELPIESIGGLWLLALFIPAIVGLIVPLIATRLRSAKSSAPGEAGEDADPKAMKAGAASTEERELTVRLFVALLNGLTWTAVLVVIWWMEVSAHNIHKMQLFSPGLTFEFYVPLLGFFGALLYVFDVLRAKDNDRFKGKEFGMRVVMAPYVAIVVVVLFGKNFDFVDLTSHTGQGALAFLSGLLVVAFLQGIIERTNEYLGRWRRRQMDYKPSPLATKFDLSEEEDLGFRSAGIRLPEQLESREESELKAAGKNSDLDTELALALKNRLDYERVRDKIGEVVWARLATDGVKTVDAFGALRDDALQKVADVDPKLDVGALKELRDDARKLTQQ